MSYQIIKILEEGGVEKLSPVTVTETVDIGMVNIHMDPAQDMHAVSLAFLNTTIGDLSNDYLKLDGSTVPTNDINMGANKIMNMADPTSNGHAANKRYVDTALANHDSEHNDSFLRLDGSFAMTGNLKMNDHIIQGVAAPVEEDDAVNLATLKSVEDVEESFGTIIALNNFLKSMPRIIDHIYTLKLLPGDYSSTFDPIQITGFIGGDGQIIIQSSNGDKYGTLVSGIESASNNVNISIEDMTIGFNTTGTNIGVNVADCDSVTIKNCVFGKATSAIQSAFSRIFIDGCISTSDVEVIISAANDSIITSSNWLSTSSDPTVAVAQCLNRSILHFNDYTQPYGDIKLYSGSKTFGPLAFNGKSYTNPTVTVPTSYLDGNTNEGLVHKFIHRVLTANQSYINGNNSVVIEFVAGNYTLSSKVNVSGFYGNGTIVFKESGAVPGQLHIDQRVTIDGSNMTSNMFEISNCSNTVEFRGLNLIANTAGGYGCIYAEGHLTKLQLKYNYFESNGRRASNDGMIEGYDGATIFAELNYFGGGDVSIKGIQMVEIFSLNNQFWTSAPDYGLYGSNGSTLKLAGSKIIGSVSEVYNDTSTLVVGN